MIIMVIVGQYFKMLIFQYSSLIAHKYPNFFFAYLFALFGSFLKRSRIPWSDINREISVEANDPGYCLDE